MTDLDRRMMEASYEGLGRDGQPVEAAWAAILSRDGRIIVQTEIKLGDRGRIFGRGAYGEVLENLKRYHRNEIENAHTLVFVHTHPSDFRFRPQGIRNMPWEFSEPDLRNMAGLRQEMNADPDWRHLTIEPHILYYDATNLGSEIGRKVTRLKKVGYAIP